MQILGTGNQAAGKQSAILIASSSLAYASWAVNFTGAKQSTNNFTSYVTALNNAFTEGLIGFVNAAFNCGGSFDFANNPLDSTPGLYPRSDLPAVQFILNVPQTILWSFDYQLVLAANNETTAEGIVNFTWSGENQGQFITPTGSFS